MKRMTLKPFFSLSNMDQNVKNITNNKKKQEYIIKIRLDTSLQDELLSKNQLSALPFYLTAEWS